MFKTISLIIIVLTTISIQNIQAQKTDSISTMLNLVSNSTQNTEQKRLKLAKLYFENTNYSDALFQCKKVLKDLKNSEENILTANTFELIADIYSENNELQDAVSYYLKANSIYEKLGQIDKSANVLMQLGSVHLKIQNFQKTFKYLNGAKSIYSKNTKENKEKLVNCYFLLGIAFGSTEKLDSSLLYFKKCEKYYSSENNAIQYGGLLNNIGALYSKKNDKELALKNYNKALIVFRQIKNDRGIGVTISNIAFINQKFGNLDEAIRLFNESNSFLNKSENSHYVLTNYSNLSDIYKTKKDYKNALYYQDKYLEIKEKISNDDILTKISEQEKKYELKKKDNEFKLIEKDNELKNKTLWFSLSAALLLVIVVSLVYRNARISLQKTKLKETLLEVEKNKLADELQYKNKELEQFAITIVEKNDFLDRLKSDVKELLKNPEDVQKIKSISVNLHQNLNLDQDRQKFEMQLDENLKSFFHKLELNFPDLTKSEKKLASLLVLELSSKDIAAILNISIDGIKKSRYRLRKKLNLESDEDLSDFLKKL